MNSTEIIIKSDDVELCAESFGDNKNPAVLLIMGAMASMVWWDSEFCRRLAAKGRFVIRYDNRDTGRSTSYSPGAPKYDVMDMAEDALHILDYYKVKKAHLAGMSLGGMIAQILALRNPERVLSLTLISSSIWDINTSLPVIDKKILDYHSSASSVNWDNEKSVINYLINGWHLLNGTRHSFNEEQAYKLAEIEVRRAKNLLSMFNHAVLKGGESYYGKLKGINLPTLIIHGTEDPVLPFAHAEALESAIPNAKLHSVKGAGHEMHYDDWDEIINAIVQQTK